MKVQLILADYIVFGLSLAISLAIGIYYNLKPGKGKGADGYLLGGREMSVLPVSFSLMASFLSAITLMGVPSEIYMFSTQFAIINLSYVIATPIAVYVYLPVFYELKVTSVNEYLEKRFNSTVRTLAMFMFIMQMILYMGIVLYAPALALSAVTSLPKWNSVIVVGLVCTAYCVGGGIKAVLWTDLFQSVLMFVCMIALALQGTFQVGGFSKVWEIAQQGDRLQFLNTSFDPTERHTIWSLMFGGIFIYLSLYGISQTQIQRLLTLPSLEKSQLSLWISWPITSMISLLTCFCGLVMYAFFVDCDPILSGEITKKDQLITLFMGKIFSSQNGFCGLIIAGIFAGSLSTVSSFVNSLAAITLQDVIKPISTKQLTNSQEVLISKGLALFYGIICLLIAYLAGKVSGLLEASLSIFSVVGGPLLSLFTLGMCSPRCNSKGAIAGFCVSLSLGLFLGFGSYIAGVPPIPLHRSIKGCKEFFNSTIINNPVVIDQPFYLFRISYMWIAAITFFVGFIIGEIVTFFSSSGKLEIDQKLLCLWLRKENDNKNKDNEIFLKQLKSANLA